MTMLYRVMQKRGGKWETWNNYPGDYANAELAACGLVQGGQATECQIVEITANGSRIVTNVSAQPATGWKHGRAVVKKQ